MQLKSFSLILLLTFFCCPIHASWVDVDGVGLSNINVSNNIENSKEPSLSLDSSGNPHIAWSDYTNTTPTAEIYYLQWNGFTWVDITGSGQANIDVSNNTGNSQTASLVLDSSGNPHIAWADNTFGNYEIFYSYWNGSAWINLGGSVDISNNTGNSQTPSLCLDSSGNPHIAWMDDTSGNWEIYYLYWNGATWVDVTGSGQINIDVSGNTGNSINPSLVLDSLGNPHIAWTDDTFSRSYIFYLWWNGSVWVDADGIGQDSISVASNFFIIKDGSAGASSLKLDNLGNPHIAWTEMYSSIPTMCYSKWNGSSWKSADGSATLDMIYSLPWPVGGYSLFNKPSLCLSTSFYPNIAYDGIVFYNSSNNYSFISFSQWNGSVWIHSNGFGAGFDYVSVFYDSSKPSLYLDNNNVPHIAYDNTSVGNEEIYFVHFVSDTPTLTVTETPTETITQTVTETYVTTTNTPTHTGTATSSNTTTVTISPTKTSTDIPTIQFSATVTLTPTVTLTMTITPTMTPYPEGDIVVYPNPFNPNEAVGGVLKIINLPIGAKVLIYTLSGELTASFTQTPVVLWNSKNSNNNTVSSGIYYYVIKSGKDRVIKTGKIFVFH